jgi:hypothetical protein
VTGPPGPCGCGCALTPDTSYGFDVVDWAATVLHFPADPWERWALIHGLELLPDGRPRFRILTVEVARQNGKTTLLVILSLWWQFVCDVEMVLGTSTKLDYAKESWHKAVRVAEAAPSLRRQRARRWTREANGEQESWTTNGARYKIAPSNEEGGRSLTVHRLILDELRQHHDYSAWAASVNAGNAVRHFQVWAISNAGDARSVVMSDLMNEATAFTTWVDEVGAEHVAELLHDAPGDYRSGLFSWSCPEDADPLDVDALALANPNLYHRIDPDALLGAARKAVHAGGEALAKFKTEAMCIWVRSMTAAFDLAAWGRCLDVGTLEGYRGRIAACLDVAPDLDHAALAVAAVLPDGRVRVEVVASWSSVDQVRDGGDGREDVLTWLARVRPYVFGWFPKTAAEALNAELAQPRGRVRRGWPPRGIRVTEIKGEASAAVMGFASLMRAGKLAQAGQDLARQHLENSEKVSLGDGGAWVVARRDGAGHVTAAYAMAGAVQLARTIPAPVKRAGLHSIG